MSLKETIEKLRQRATRIEGEVRELKTQVREKAAAYEELLDTIGFLVREEEKRTVPLK